MDGLTLAAAPCCVAVLLGSSAPHGVELADDSANLALHALQAAAMTASLADVGAKQPPARAQEADSARHMATLVVHMADTQHRLAVASTILATGEMSMPPSFTMTPPDRVNMAGILVNMAEARLNMAETRLEQAHASLKSAGFVPRTAPSPGRLAVNQAEAAPARMLLAHLAKWKSPTSPPRADAVMQLSPPLRMDVTHSRALAYRAVRTADGLNGKAPHRAEGRV